MKNAFRAAYIYYKYFSLLFLIFYSMYIIYDDYIFIKNISSLSGFLEQLELEIEWLFSYFLVYSIYFWMAAVVSIYTYQKLLKPAIKGKG